MNSNNYTGSESQWRDHANARELAELRREEADLADFTFVGESPRTHPMPWNHDAGPKCCEKPEYFIHRENHDVDPETGYSGESYFECVVCGSRIALEDFSALCTWADERAAVERKQAVREIGIPVREKAA